MSWEAEANVAGVGRARRKSAAKPPPMLEPRGRLAEKEGRLRNSF